MSGMQFGTDVQQHLCQISLFTSQRSRS